MDSATRKWFPPWAECLFRRARYKAIRGGRGSGKSWAVARALILRAAQRKLRILCTREFQNSISESCPRTFVEPDPRDGPGAQV